MSEFAASRAQPRTSPASAVSSQPCSELVTTVMPALQGEPLSHRLDLRVVVEARRAEGPPRASSSGCRTAHSTALYNIRRLAQSTNISAVGHNQIVAVDFDVELRDPLDRLALHD